MHNPILTCNVNSTTLSESGPVVRSSPPVRTSGIVGRGFRVAGYSINGSVHFICVDWSHIGETLLVGKAVSNNKLLTLLIAMRSDVLDSWVVVKGGFLNAHPSQ